MLQVLIMKTMVALIAMLLCYQQAAADEYCATKAYPNLVKLTGPDGVHGICCPEGTGGYMDQYHQRKCCTCGVPECFNGCLDGYLEVNKVRYCCDGHLCSSDACPGGKLCRDDTTEVLRTRNGVTCPGIKTYKCVNCGNDHYVDPTSKDCTNPVCIPNGGVVIDTVNTVIDEGKKVEDVFSGRRKVLEAYNVSMPSHRWIPGTAPEHV